MIRLALPALLFCALISPLSAQTASWNNTSAFWGDPTSWTPNGVPTSTTDVIFGATAASTTVDLGGISRDLNSLTFSGTSSATQYNLGLTSGDTSTLNFTSGGSLTLNTGVTKI